MKLTDSTGTFTLANGIKMPYLGLGVWKAKDGDEVQQSIDIAFKNNYRHIDTAAMYKNEKGVGQAVRNSTLPRDQIFVTTKVLNADQGYDSTMRAFEKSNTLLDIEYIDLYLVHWPVKNKYKETWRALESLYKDGKVKAIGVSNFLVHHLEDLLDSAHIKPMVNQFEHHPRLVQQELCDFCKKHEIQAEAWSPLMQGQIIDIKELDSLSAKYNKSIAQIVIRWNLQNEVIVIPKSTNSKRIAENAAVFDFEISEEDMALINRLDQHQRVGPDPDNFDF